MKPNATKKNRQAADKRNKNSQQTTDEDDEDDDFLDPTANPFDPIRRNAPTIKPDINTLWPTLEKRYK